MHAKNIISSNRQVMKRKFNFCHQPLRIFDKKFEDLKRLNKPMPKRESLLLYRDCIKLSKKFIWNDDNGKQWSKILLSSIRKEFEDSKLIDDHVEIGKKLVIGRQSIIELNNKLVDIEYNVNVFLEKTKISK